MDAATAPPRAYSIGQPDFNPDIGRRLRICVDGVEQREVVEYDCDAGTVLKNRLNSEGRAQVDPNNREQVWRETVRGNVTAEWKMANDTLTVDAREIMSKVTIEVRMKGFGAAKARLWLAGKIMAFAGLVAGCECEVTTDFSDA